MSTFYRLLGFLRPYRRGVIVSGVLASIAMVMTVLIPYLTGQAGEAIHKGASHSQHHQAAALSQDRETLTLLAAAIVVAVLARWALTYWRRIIAGHVSLGIEYDLRKRLYKHLQSLELGFVKRSVSHVAASDWQHCHHVVGRDWQTPPSSRATTARRRDSRVDELVGEHDIPSSRYRWSNGCG